MTPANAAIHTRENLSVLAQSEKQALIWIARRLPPFINSDHLSALGLVAMAGAGLSFAAYRLTDWAAVGVVVSLVANWFGDSLDGTVARVRNQQRPRYGFYVDHIIDVAGTTLLFTGMAWSGLMSPVVALVALVLFLAQSRQQKAATTAFQEADQKLGTALKPLLRALCRHPYSPPAPQARLRPRLHHNAPFQ